MIDVVDRKLKDWVADVTDSADIFFDLPGDSANKSGINLYLVDVLQTPPTHGPHPATQVVLRYLVTVWDQRPGESHRLLGELVFAALDNPELEVEREPISLTLWTALRVAPRPAFLLRVILRRERQLTDAPLVRRPLDVQNAPLGEVHGVVLGPDDIPIAAARIDVPALQVGASSDKSGRFHLTAPRSVGRPMMLRVNAKGKQIELDAAEAVVNGEPLVVRLNLSES